MRLTSHFKKLLGANFIVAFLGVATGVILARNLSVEDRGELAEILLWVGFGVTVGSESVREFCLSFKSSDQNINVSVLALASAISFILPIAFLIDNNLSEYIGYALAFSGVNVVTILYLAKVQLQGEFARLSFYKMVVPLVNFVLLLATFFFDFAIWFALLALLSANFALLCLVVVKEPRIKVSSGKQLGSYLNVLFSIVVITAISQMDRMIMAKVSDAKDMAYFVIALTVIATPLTIIGQTMSSYLVIDIKNRTESINRYIEVRLLALLMVLSAIAMTIFLVAEGLITLVFGEKYLPAASYVVLCSCITLLNNTRSLYNYACLLYTSPSPRDS